MILREQSERFGHRPHLAHSLALERSLEVLGKLPSCCIVNTGPPRARPGPTYLFEIHCSCAHSGRESGFPGCEERVSGVVLSILCTVLSRWRACTCAHEKPEEGIRNHGAGERCWSDALL